VDKDMIIKGNKKQWIERSIEEHELFNPH